MTLGGEPLDSALSRKVKGPLSAGPAAVPVEASASRPSMGACGVESTGGGSDVSADAGARVLLACVC